MPVPGRHQRRMSHATPALKPGRFPILRDRVSVLSQETLEHLVESLRLLQEDGVPGLRDDLEL